MLQSNEQMKEYVTDVFNRTVSFMELEGVKLVFNAQEWNKYTQSKNKNNKIRKSRAYGRAWKSYDETCKILIINIENHDNIKSLNDTIVHELLHIKDYKLNHGARFDNIVNRYLEQLFDYGMIKGKLKKYEGSKY